jgi:hypothetical protein
MDDENETVEFFETDWNTYMSVRTRIENNPDLRHELSHVIPERSLLPQSMSLQFIVRFDNGELLAMKRKEGIAWESGSWAFTAEEQLHQRDFQSREVGAAEYLFRRAFIEEIFGHRTEDEDYLNRIWADDCSPIIQSHRIWSFFLEENAGIFQTFGVFQLRINPPDLRAIHQAAVSAGWGTTDPEGYWYVVDEADAERLLTHGRCEAHRLNGDPEHRPITAGGLHTTSRYRLWRLYCALNRSARTMAALKIRPNPAIETDAKRRRGSSPRR